MTHKIDKAKVEEELKKRGWKRGIYHEWITPAIYTQTQSEEDWTAAILIGIVCEHEEKIKENQEFLKTHPSPQRHM